MRLPLALLALALSTAALAESPKTVDDALAQAKKAHQPVFIDFGAPWCYSCYFMMTHVLNGAEWERLESRTVVAEVDADSPDGALDQLALLVMQAQPAMRREDVLVYCDRMVDVIVQLARDGEGRHVSQVRWSPRQVRSLGAT